MIVGLGVGCVDCNRAISRARRFGDAVVTPANTAR